MIVGGRRPRRRGGRFVRSLILRLMRELKVKTPEELAEGAGLKKSTILNLERGKDEPRLSTLEKCMRALNVSMAAFEEMLDLAQEIRDGELPDQWVGPVWLDGQRLTRARNFGRTFGNLQRDNFSDYVVRTWVEEQAEKDREFARQIGIYLRGHDNLAEIVREDPGCHLWSVAEWLCEASMKTLPQDRKRAGLYAQAALTAAELAPGEQRFQMLLQGYTWGHIGNYRRVVDIRSADAPFESCAKFLTAGAGGDPYGILDMARLLGMEASLRRDQGHLPQALQLVRRALDQERDPELRIYWGINHGFVLEQLGDSTGSIRVLDEVAPKTPEHLLVNLRINQGVSLTHLGRLDEVESMIPEMSRLAIQSGSADNEMRVRWVSGRVALGRGRRDEAKAYFRSLHSDFLRLENTYDAALVSLELARAYLDEGETATVKLLAQQMAPVFADNGIHKRAQEALQLFQEAAQREAVSVEFLIRIILYLHRARRVPELAFPAVG